MTGTEIFTQKKYAFQPYTFRKKQKEHEIEEKKKKIGHKRLQTFFFDTSLLNPMSPPYVSFYFSETPQPSKQKSLEEPSGKPKKERNFYIIELPTLKRGMKGMRMASLDKVGNVPIIAWLAAGGKRNLEGTNMGISSIWVE